MRRGQYKHLLNYIANLITLIFHTTAFAVIWYQVYANWVGYYTTIVPFAKRGNWAIIGIYALIVFFFTRIFGGYRIGYMRLGDIILSCVLALILSNIVAYFELCLVWRDYVNAVPLLIMTCAEIAFSIIWNLLIRVLYKALYPPRDMLLIYGNYDPSDLIQKMNGRHDKYNICSTLDFTKHSFTEICEEVDKFSAVVFSDLPGELRNDVLKHCYKKGIRVYCAPKITDILFRAADDIHLFDTPLYLFRNQGLTIDQRFVKRFIDIILSIVGIIVSSPIMLIIAFLVKVYDGGPVFYKQERLTRDGEVFRIIKFRSMREASKEDPEHITMKDDDRVTPIGKVIRNIHLDELPQLFNILVGQMSFVGPRPEWKMTTDLYSESVPEFRLRLKVKAGLTGYAQVMGKYNTTPYDKLKLDLTYIENYSIWLDFKIILLTVKILFKKEATEGIDNTQKTALK